MEVGIHAIERAAVEVALVVIVLRKGFAMEAGQAAELAVETKVPALCLDAIVDEIGLGIGLGPGVTGGQADAAGAKAIVGTELEAVTLRLDIIVDVERNARDHRSVAIVSVLVTAEVDVAPEAKPDRRRRLAGFSQHFVSALVPHGCHETRDDERVEGGDIRRRDQEE